MPAGVIPDRLFLMQTGAAEFVWCFGTVPKKKRKLFADYFGVVFSINTIQDIDYMHMRTD